MVRVSCPASGFSSGAPNSSGLITGRAGLLERLEKHRSGFERKDSALVSRGLRQFFVAYLMSGKRYVSMPSQVADDLWHEFILYTREYDAFCRRAFGGFLHHTPAVVLSEHRRSNEGLRRVWWYCCKYENIDPVNPTRLPLLFALDSKLNIPNGFVYHPQCEELRKNGSGAAYCGGDFADSVGRWRHRGLWRRRQRRKRPWRRRRQRGGGGGDGGGGGCGGGDWSAGRLTVAASLPDLLDAEVSVDAPHGLFAPPFFAVALDRKQIIGRRRIMPVCQRRGRRHADHGDLAVGAFDPDRRMNVVVAVQDQFHAVPFQHGAERLRIGQPLDARTRVQGMMHQQHPKGLIGGHLRQMAIQRIELRAAEPAGCHQGQRRDRRGHADQRQRPAPAQERKGVPFASAIVARRYFSNVSAKRCRVART